MKYDIRIRNLTAPRSPTLFRGSATEALIWMRGRHHRSDEALFAEVKANRRGYPLNSWHPLRGRLDQYAEKESH